MQLTELLPHFGPQFKKIETQQTSRACVAMTLKGERSPEHCLALGISLNIAYSFIEVRQSPYAGCRMHLKVRDKVYETRDYGTGWI